MAQKVSRRLVAAIIADKLLERPNDGEAIMRQAAAYLIANNQVEYADVLMNDIAEALFEHGGHLSVEVTTAHALTDGARQQLTTYLRDKTGATAIDMHESVEPDLIGGFTARTASSELDASIRHKLQQLRALA